MKFKNTVTVLGSKKALLSFAKKLEEIGYNPDPETINGSTFGEWWSERLVAIMTDSESNTYAFHNHDTEGYDFRYNLPKQRRTAIKKVSETLND